MLRDEAKNQTELQKHINSLNWTNQNCIDESFSKEDFLRPISFEDDLSRLIDQAQPSLLFEGATQEEFYDWRERFRDVLTGLIGPRPERAALCLEFEEEIDCGLYRRRRISYQTESGVFVPAYLLVPKGLAQGEKVPGLLCIHGHGHFGKDSVVGLNDTPERQAEIDKCSYDFGHGFAEQGYVVLAPDLRGFGERRPGYPGPRTDFCPRNYMCATLLGTTVVALHLCDLEAALDVLQVLDFVDGERLGCAGLSLGGTDDDDDFGI